MKRIVVGALVFFGGLGAVFAEASSPSAAVPSNVEQPEAPRPLRAYAVTKVDPLTLSSTMDSPGTYPGTPYLAGSTGRYGVPKGPVLSSTLSGAYRASVVSEGEARGEAAHWGDKK